MAGCYSEDPGLLMTGEKAICHPPTSFFFLLKIQSTSQECLSGLAWAAWLSMDKSECSPGWVPSVSSQRVDPDKRNQASIRKRK